MTPRYQDLADEPEDERVRKIAAHLNGSTVGTTVAFVTDDEPGKPERYLAKLRELVPDLVVMFRGPGPVDGGYTVKVIRALA